MMNSKVVLGNLHDALRSRFLWTLLFSVGCCLVATLLTKPFYGQPFGLYVLCVAVLGSVAGTLTPLETSGWRILQLIVVPLIGLGLTSVYCCGHLLTLLGPSIMWCGGTFAMAHALRALPQLTPRGPILLAVVLLAIPLLYFGNFITELVLRKQQGATSENIVTGQVVDASDGPDIDYEVAHYWSSNGIIWDQYGNYTPPEDTNWTNEGDMEPLPRDTALALPGGYFRLETVSRRLTFLALSKDRTLGGFVVVNPDTKFPVEIVTGPLVRVHGSVRTANNAVPNLLKVVVYPVSELGHGYFTVCNSTKGEFSFLLPPGEYEVGASSSGPAGSYLTVQETTQFTHNLATGRISLVVHNGQGMLKAGVLEISTKAPPN